jgi:hypothetical protein
MGTCYLNGRRFLGLVALFALVNLSLSAVFVAAQQEEGKSE